MQSLPRGAHPVPRSLSAYLAPIFLVAILALGGLSFAGGHDGRAPAASFQPFAGASPIVVTATDVFSFQPASITVTTLNVYLEIENVATVDHTFTLSSRVNATAPAGTDASTNASGTWFDTAHLLADVAIPAGKTAFLNVTLPAAGSFQFICRYHFTSAMVGQIAVSTSSTTSTASGTPLYLYAGIAIAVVVAVVVVAALVMRSRGKAPPVEPAPK